MLGQTLLSAAILASLALAKDNQVEIGKSGSTFSPDTVKADAGDVVVFHLLSTSHNVVQGDFSKPCSPLSSGFYSGYPSSANTTTFSVTVNSTDPIYFYCSTTGHCQGGMVGVINPPTSGNTLDAYRKAAKTASGSSAPAAVAGGVLKAEESKNDSSDSASAKATASADDKKHSSASSAIGAAATGNSSKVSGAASAGTTAAATAKVSASATESAKPAQTGAATSNHVQKLLGVVGGIVGLVTVF